MWPPHVPPSPTAKNKHFRPSGDSKRPQSGPLFDPPSGPPGRPSEGTPEPPHRSPPGQLRMLGNDEVLPFSAHFIIFHHILSFSFHFIMFYCILFYRILFHFALSYFNIFHSIPLHFILIHSISLHLIIFILILKWSEWSTTIWNLLRFWHLEIYTIPFWFIIIQSMSFHFIIFYHNSFHSIPFHFLTLLWNNLNNMKQSGTCSNSGTLSQVTSIQTLSFMVAKSSPVFNIQ